MNRILIIVTVLICLQLKFLPTNGLKILGLFPHPGTSHFQVFHPIMRGLATAGHDVTVVSRFPDKNPLPNYKDFELTGLEVYKDVVDLKDYSHRPSYTFIKELFELYYWGIESCENAINSTVIQNLIKTKPYYDVIVMEQFNNDCLMGVAWILNAPVVGLSSCIMMPYLYERVGFPHHPSFIPSSFVAYSEKMSFTERLHNWFAIHLINFLYKMYSEPEGDRLIRKHIGNDDIPYLGDLVKRTSLILTNTHYSLSGAVPLPPTVIEIGGAHICDPKPIDKDLKDILDSATDGIIFVSWGSMIRADTLPENKRNAFINVFNSLKQKILWKWENDTLPNGSDNIIIRKWLPQRDILCHANVKAFVTHGGMLGTSEAVYCGVPMVVTPIYGDQYTNGAAIENRKIGKIVEYETISVKTITTAIEYALLTETKENAVKVSYEFRNRPKSPIETAVWWIEHVATTDGLSLGKSKYKHLSTFVAYSFDIYATFALFILSIFTCNYLIVKLIFRKRFNKIKQQ